MSITILVAVVNRSWLTVLAATGFNLLFEYSMRGINNLPKQPLLPLVLFMVYFSLFTMQNDLITRFRLKDYHLMVLAFSFGTVYQFLVSGAAILQPQVLGVNWTNMLFVIVVWWGMVQSIVTFYIATRVAPRDWGFRLSRTGWIIALIINGFVVLLFQLSPAIPKANSLQLTFMLAISAFAIASFRTLLHRNSQKYSPVSSRSKLMDAVSALTIFIFFFSATLLTFDPIIAKTSNVNATATFVITAWTIILFLIVGAYRLGKGRSITV